MVILKTEDIIDLMEPLKEPIYKKKRISTKNIENIGFAEAPKITAAPEIKPKGVISKSIPVAVKQLKGLGSQAANVLYPTKPIEEGFMRPTGLPMQALQKFGAGYTGRAFEPIRSKLGIPKMPPAESPGIERAGKIAELGGLLAGIPTKGALAAPKLATKAFPRLAGKGILPKSARLGLETATFSALEDISRPSKDIAFNSVLAGMIGAAIPGGIKTLKTVSMPFRKFGTAIAGVYPATVKQIKRIGYNRVADPVKREAAYFTDQLFPRVKENFENLMGKFTPKTQKFLELHKVNPKSIDTIKKKGWNQTKAIYDAYGQNLGNMADKIKVGANIVKKDASNKFDLAFNKSKIDKINIKETFYKLRNDLHNLGLVDKAGNPMEEKFGNTALDGLLKIYNNMRTHVVSKKMGKDVVTGVINKAQYNQYKMAIEALEGTVPAANRYVFKTVKNLRNDAKEAIPALKTAMVDYAKAMDMQDQLYTTTGNFKINENFLNKKWNLATKRVMDKINQELPTEYKFIDDLDKFKTAKEIVPIEENYTNAIKVDEMLAKLRQYKEPTHAKIQDIESKFASFADKEITKDALAHYLAKDIYQEILQAGFMGVAGATRKGAELGVRTGLKLRDIYKRTLEPKIKQLTD